MQEFQHVNYPGPGDLQEKNENFRRLRIIQESKQVTEEEMDLTLLAGRPSAQRLSPPQPGLPLLL
jgi:hypothetical protein